MSDSGGMMISTNATPVNGPHKELFADDRLSYESGKKIGEWKVYDKSGALKQVKVFKQKK